MKTGIAVLFPGTGYTCAEPLMEGCAQKYAALGYDIVALSFAGIPFREIEALEEAVEQAERTLPAQMAEISFEAYADIVFISKSLGTVCAGRLEARLARPPRQLYLTPLPQTLPYVKESSQIIAMVIGTRDTHMDSADLRDFCAKRGIPCMVVEGVGHNLKDERDPERTREINAGILALCT